MARGGRKKRSTARRRARAAREAELYGGRVVTRVETREGLRLLDPAVDVIDIPKLVSSATAKNIFLDAHKRQFQLSEDTLAWIVEEDWFARDFVLNLHPYDAPSLQRTMRRGGWKKPSAARRRKRERRNKKRAAMREAEAEADQAPVPAREHGLRGRFIVNVKSKSELRHYDPHRHVIFPVGSGFLLDETSISPRSRAISRFLKKPGTGSRHS